MGTPSVTVSADVPAPASVSTAAAPAATALEAAHQLAEDLRAELKRAEEAYASAAHAYEQNVADLRRLLDTDPGPASASARTSSLQATPHASSSDDANRCANCDALFEERRFLYCTKCGTKRNCHRQSLQASNGHRRSPNPSSAAAPSLVTLCTPVAASSGAAGETFVFTGWLEAELPPDMFSDCAFQPQDAAEPSQCVEELHPGQLERWLTDILNEEEAAAAACADSTSAGHVPPTCATAGTSPIPPLPPTRRGRSIARSVSSSASHSCAASMQCHAAPYTAAVAPQGGPKPRASSLPSTCPRVPSAGALCKQPVHSAAPTARVSYAASKMHSATTVASARRLSDAALHSVLHAHASVSRSEHSPMAPSAPVRHALPLRCTATLASSANPSSLLPPGLVAPSAVARSRPSPTVSSAPVTPAARCGSLQGASMSTGVNHAERSRNAGPAALAVHHGGKIGKRFPFDSTLFKTSLPDTTTVDFCTRQQTLDKSVGQTCGGRPIPLVLKPSRDKPSSERRDPTKGLGEFAALLGPSGFRTFPKVSSTTGKARLLPTSSLRWGSGPQAEHVGLLREKSPRAKKNARVCSYEAVALEHTENTSRTRARGFSVEGNLPAPSSSSVSLSLFSSPSLARTD